MKGKNARLFKGLLILFLVSILSFHAYNKYYSCMKNPYYEDLIYKEKSQNIRTIKRFNLGQFKLIASDTSGEHKIEYCCEIAYYGDNDAFFKCNLDIIRSKTQKAIYDSFSSKELYEEYFRPHEIIKREIQIIQAERRDDSIEINNIYLPVFLIDPK